MKVLKKAEVRNFAVDDWYYTEKELNAMQEKGIIEKFDFDDNPYRVFVSDLDEVKVVYNYEFNIYHNVAVRKDGTRISIVL